MRFIPIIIFTIFSATIFAQEVTLSKEELKNFRDFEGSQVDFNYNELVGDYIYSTQTLKQLSADVTNAQVKIHAYIKLIKHEDEYCFSDVHLGFNLFRQGVGSTYNSVEVLIGFTTNIKKGDAIKYEFDLTSDAGNASIQGEEINEIISKSREMKRPITINFYNDETQISSMMISYARVNQKLGGILSTQSNLLEKYIRCQD
jgi:hypothetical protein